MHLNLRAVEMTAPSSKLCIASCEELLAADGMATATYGISGCDELALYASLEARGVEFDVKAWDDAAIDWSSYGLVIVRTTWDYSKSEAKAAAFQSWLSRLSKLGVAVYNDSRILSWNVHKGYLSAMAAKGVPTIPSQLIPAGSSVGDCDLEAITSKHAWAGRLLMKPCVSGGSRGCMRVDRQSVALQQGSAFLHAMVTTGNPPPSTDAAASSGDSDSGDNAAVSSSSSGGCDMLLQPYISSVESAGELSVVVIDGAISHALVKTPLPGEYRTQEEHGGVPTRVEVSQQMRAAVQAVLAAAKACVEEADPSRGPLPDDAFLLARCDFLRVPKAGLHVDSSSTPVNEGNSDLVLLELEVIEPCMFFGCAPSRPDSSGNSSSKSAAAEALVTAIVRRQQQRAADVVAAT